MDDLTKTIVKFLFDLGAALPKLFQIWSNLGSRDAFLAAVDSMLEAGRAKTDADITQKHRT